MSARKIRRVQLQEDSVKRGNLNVGMVPNVYLSHSNAMEWRNVQTTRMNSVGVKIYLDKAVKKVKVMNRI